MVNTHNNARLCIDKKSHPFACKIEQYFHLSFNKVYMTDHDFQNGIQRDI